MLFVPGDEQSLVSVSSFVDDIDMVEFNISKSVARTGKCSTGIDERARLFILGIVQRAGTCDKAWKTFGNERRHIERVSRKTKTCETRRHRRENIKCYIFCSGHYNGTISKQCYAM